jgi:hypothetical protein
MPEPIEVIRRQGSGNSRRLLYLLAMAAGAAGALYVYGVAFDDLSEEQLVQLSALWLLPLVFGAYGFVAEKLLKLIDEGDDLSIARAALIWTNALPVIGIVLLLPFLFIKGSNPTAIALIGSLFWVVLLLGFLMVVFPLL